MNGEVVSLQNIKTLWCDMIVIVIFCLVHHILFKINDVRPIFIHNPYIFILYLHMVDIRYAVEHGDQIYFNDQEEKTCSAQWMG